MKTLLIITALLINGFSHEDDPANKLYIKAYDFILEENWDSAIDTFNQLIKDFPKSVFYDDAHFWIAYATNEKGEQESAFELFGKFIEQFKDSNLADDATRSRIKIAKKLYQQGKTNYQQYVNESETTERNLEEISLQKAVIYSLYKKGGQEELNSIKRMALSDNYSIAVRKEAIYYFFKSKEQRDVEKIGKEFFSSLKESSLRKEVIYHIYKTNAKDVNEFLKHVATDEKEDYNIRKEAIYYIYKMEDFESLKLVYSQIDQPTLNKEII
ncbi:MAG: outer membrane protein assembly factor BamD, partial [Calditrichaeota bacterium]|nr:outer membrane protein assembly factor BamD [Calditrichota bacterium]